MASNEALRVMFPPGRLVFTDAQDKNDKGEPFVDAKGAPYTKRTLGVAIPKTGETDWRQTPWGQQLHARALEDWKGGQPSWPSFAHKIEDGDSTVPNRRGNKNADKEGWPGHWIVKFSSNFPIKLVDAKGGPTTMTPDQLYAGCFVQVYGSAKGNGSSESPGMFVNYEIVAFAAHGERIEGTGSVDPTTVGFGQAALPPGASATPPAQMAEPQQAPPPRQEFSGGATPPPPPAVDRRTPKAHAEYPGVTVEAMLAWNGWTEAALVQHGYLTP